jgi:hypothetical protein
MIAEMPAAGWLALGYGAVLVLVAYGVDVLARRAAHRIEQDRSGGFSYHEDHDAWLCPQDQWLWPTSFDPDNRVMRYRASPTVCNACPVKHTCTTSASGREMSRAVDSWPASEAARFHRGIACAITVLAVAWPLATAVAGGGSTAATAMLITGSVVLGALSLPLWSHLRRTPGDPGGVLVRTLDDTVAERTHLARTHQRRRTTYASDRRHGRREADHVD